VSDRAPPRAARLLLRALSAGIAEGILGDLDEVYRGRGSDSGRRAADRWYWQEVAVSSPYLVRLRFRDAVRECDLMAVGAGVSAVAGWFLVFYMMIAILSPADSAPLGNLHPALFLVVWVVGAGVMGGFVSRWWARGRGSLASLIVGLSVCFLLLLGIDEGLSIMRQISVCALVLSGARAGVLVAGLRRGHPSVSASIV